MANRATRVKPVFAIQAVAQIIDIDTPSGRRLTDFDPQHRTASFQEPPQPAHHVFLKPFDVDLDQVCPCDPLGIQIVRRGADADLDQPATPVIGLLFE